MSSQIEIEGPPPPPPVVPGVTLPPAPPPPTGSHMSFAAQLEADAKRLIEAGEADVKAAWDWAKDGISRLRRDL